MSTKDATVIEAMSPPPLPEEPVPERPADGALPDDAGEDKAEPTKESTEDKDEPPLPTEDVSECPPDQATVSTSEVAPSEEADDGWEAVWEPAVSQYYFYNRITNETTWDNPRVPEESQKAPAPETLAERLAKDPEFQKLSRSERIKRYEEEQSKEAERTEEEPENIVAIGDVNVKQHAALLASTFGHTVKPVIKEHHRVSKDELKKFKKQKKEKKDRQMKAWLLED